MYIASDASEAPWRNAPLVLSEHFRRLHPSPGSEHDNMYEELQYNFGENGLRMTLLKEAESKANAVLIVLTPDFFHHDELMQEVVALLKEPRRDAATILPMYSTVLPFEDYATLCESTPMAQELLEGGLLDKHVWEKWPQAPALQFTAAKHTVMTRVPKPNWLGAHANTHGGSWIRGC